MSPKRTPVAKAKKGKKTPKIKRDLIAEYQQTVKKSKVAEILTLADEDCLANVKLHISTQSLELDRLLNGKGIPTGRISEIYGMEHIGKSTILDHLFAETQKLGGIGVLFDTETARDSTYTSNIGVDISKLQYVKFKRDEMHIENVLTQIYDAVEFWRDKAPDTPVVIGWDALGGTATRDEVEKRLEKEARTAQAASVLRKAARQLPSKLGNTKIAVVILNHFYQAGIGGGGRPHKETYGGGAIRLLASIRLQLHPVQNGWVKDNTGVVVGRRVGADLIKNRLGNPFGKTEFVLLSGIGIDNVSAVNDRLQEAGIIVTSGSWSAINLDEKKISWQGRNGLMKKCEEDETLFPRLVNLYKTLE